MNRSRSIALAACVFVSIAPRTSPAQQVQVDVTRAQAIELRDDHEVCSWLCPWWAQEDFYTKVKFLSDGSEFVSPQHDQRDDCVFTPPFEALGPIPPTQRFVPLRVQLWDEDPGADDQFDPAERPGTDLNLSYDACLGTWNDSVRFYGPVPAVSSADPGTQPYTEEHARGLEGDPARMWLGVSRIGNIPLIPNDIDITGATPVQVVPYPSRIIAGKPSVFRVDLASSWPGYEPAELRVTVTDQISTFYDELSPFLVPPGASTVWLFQNAPFIPQKFFNSPFLTWTVELIVPSEVQCVADAFPGLFNWGCCNLENNTKSTVPGPTALPIVVTRNPLTLYAAYALNPAPTDLPTDSEMQAMFDFGEAFRTATFPIAPPLNGFRLPARFVLRDDPGCAFFGCFEPYASTLRWSRAARVAGINTLVLTTAPGWISRLGSYGAPWLSDFSASGVTLAEFSPNAVLAEAEATTVAPHEIAHTFQLSQRPCHSTIPELGVLEAIFPTLGCRDEYFHESPPRPYQADGYDVQGLIYPSGFSWDGSSWDTVGTLPACSPPAPGTREVKCAINLMDKASLESDPRSWIDRHSYDFLTEKLLSAADPPLVSVYGSLAPIGGWNANPLRFSGSLGTSYVFTGVPDMAESPIGGHSGDGFFAIVLETPNGSRTYRFDGMFQGDGSVRFDGTMFALTVPWDSATTRIRLFGPSDAKSPGKNQDLLLATIQRTVQPPVVGSLFAGRNQPWQGGPQPEPPTIGPNDTAHISWSAVDADSPNLYAILDLWLPDSDGQARVPIAVDRQTASFVIAHDTLDWAPGTYGGRVTVSDGINTTQFENTAFFTICNLTNSGVEICDNLDNDCDGVVDDVVAPTDVVQVKVEKTKVTWTAVPSAESYDVVVGNLATLRATGGNFTQATSGCLANNLAAVSTPYPGVPAPGSPTWFLVRPVNCAGAGTYDSLAPSQVASRDAEIAASPVACP